MEQLSKHCYFTFYILQKYKFMFTLLGFWRGSSFGSTVPVTNIFT